MSGINPKTLARMRRVALRSLTQTCTIAKESTTTGTFGEQTHETEIVAENVACRLVRAGQASTGGAGLAGEREVMEERYRLVLPVGTTVGADYTATVDGVTYLVTRVQQALTDEVFTQCVVVRKDG